ncbi:MAG: L,D-transpeptidase family protein, partial [Deltaproteobacteria bacterium]|nr:L,D-transpeptidase family protein [Deltaproteobacteria bacterium]
MRRRLPRILLLTVLASCGRDAGDALPDAGPQAPAAADAARTPSGDRLAPPSGEEMRARVRKKAAERKKEALEALEVLPKTDIGDLVEATLDFVEDRFSNERLFYSRYLEEFDRKLRMREELSPLLREIYTSRKHELLFHDFEDKIQTLNEEGRRLLAFLREMPTHGLPAADYRLDSMDKQIRRYDEARAEYVAAREGEFDPREQRFWQLVSGYEDLPEDVEVRRDLLTLELTNQDLVALKNFQAYYQRLLKARAALNDAAADIDIDLLQGFFRFQLDFVHLVRAHPFRTDPARTTRAEAFLDELRTAYQEAGGRFVEAMKPRIPDNPVYHRLREGLVFYERLDGEGEVDGLRLKGKLGPGQRGDAVRTLTKRLALEGYLAPEQAGDRYTKEVERAVRWYQRTHQMEEDGAMGPVTRRSLEVSMARRAKQIRLGLQRWRESEIHRDRPDLYFRVNIPQFEVELWEHNELLRVHRLVVGQHSEEVNLQKKQRGFLNHTALLKSQMETIVLKPRWYPPPRLQQELLSELETDPAYFEKNNYGFIQKDDGTEIVFQKPGGANALGMVKLLFPNEHNVYMHDTPKKNLFRRPVRAYSHGCMRTEKPLELAQYLLERFNGISREEFDRIMAKDPEKETFIKLQTPVPIHIEYNSVSADEDGKVRFFIDVYKYDEAYWEDHLPVQIAEDLSSSEVR